MNLSTNLPSIPLHKRKLISFCVSISFLPYITIIVTPIVKRVKIFPYNTFTKRLGREEGFFPKQCETPNRITVIDVAGQLQKFNNSFI